MRKTNFNKLVSVPLHVDMGVKKIKRHYFNLNTFRNNHYQVNNQLKRAYKALVLPQIEGSVFRYVKLTFTLYRGDKRRVDRANVLSVHEKFFSDALVESGCIVDDNDSFIQSSHYYSGEVDKVNPRVDILIEDVVQ